MLSVIIVLKSCSTGGMKAVVWTDVFQLVGHHIGQHQHHYCCHDHWLLSIIVHLILLVFIITKSEGVHVPLHGLHNRCCYNGSWGAIFRFPKSFSGIDDNREDDIALTIS